MGSNGHILSMIGLAKKGGAVWRSVRSRWLCRPQRGTHSGSFWWRRMGGQLCAPGVCLCTDGGLPVSDHPADKDALGRALAAAAALWRTITDVGFADAIVKKLAVMDPEHYEQASQRSQIKRPAGHGAAEEQARHEKNLRRGQEAHGSPEPPQPGRQEPPRGEAAKEKP